MTRQDLYFFRVIKNLCEANVYWCLIRCIRQQCRNRVCHHIVDLIWKGTVIKLFSFQMISTRLCLLRVFGPSPIAQSAAYQTWEKEVSSSIPGSANIFNKYWWCHCDRIHSSLTAVHCFENGYVIKQPVAWRDYCMEHWLTHYQMTYIRLFQTERVCRRQFQIWRKWKKVIETGRKHCGKRWNCLLRAISPFPTVFLKDLFPRDVKRCHCMGMG